MSEEALEMLKIIFGYTDEDIAKVKGDIHIPDQVGNCLLDDMQSIHPQGTILWPKDALTTDEAIEEDWQRYTKYFMGVGACMKCKLYPHNASVYEMALQGYQIAFKLGKIEGAKQEGWDIIEALDQRE